MSSSDKSSQKSSSARGGGSRKTGVSPLSINTTQDQSIRDTQYPDEEYLLMEDDPYASNPPRSPSSAIRLNPPVTRRSSRDTGSGVLRSPNPNVPARRTQRANAGPPTGAVRPGRNVTTAYDVPPARKQAQTHKNRHWLFYVGVGMVASVALWALGAAALAWGTNEYNNIVYGYPRTFQTDAVVGHNHDGPGDPSHFIAMNLHGQIVIIELPAGDPTKSIDYVLSNQLTGSGSDLYPVTLTFVNHGGRVDMLVHIEGQTIPFSNTGTKFVLETTSPTSTPTTNSTPTP